jgi:hypothetical protein
VPHPGHQHEPADGWSDGGTPPGGRVSKIGWLHPRRRAVRLAAAIGVVLGVLCIVLGTLALVVELGPAHPAKPHLTAFGHGRYEGSGNGQAESIPVGGRGPHVVAWSFRCPRGKSGFKMAIGRPTNPSSPGVNSPDVHGSGHWLDPRNGRHSVVIITKCNWRARVFKPNPTPKPSNSSGHQHGALTTNPHNKQHGYDKPGHKRKAHYPRQNHSPGPAGGA